MEPTITQCTQRSWFFFKKIALDHEAFGFSRPRGHVFFQQSLQRKLRGTFSTIEVYQVDRQVSRNPSRIPIPHISPGTALSEKLEGRLRNPYGFMSKFRGHSNDKIPWPLRWNTMQSLGFAGWFFQPSWAPSAMSLCRVQRRRQLGFKLSCQETEKFLFLHVCVCICPCWLHILGTFLSVRSSTKSVQNAPPRSCKLVYKPIQL